MPIHWHNLLNFFPGKKNCVAQCCYLKCWTVVRNVPKRVVCISQLYISLISILRWTKFVNSIRHFLPVFPYTLYHNVAYVSKIETYTIQQRSEIINNYLKLLIIIIMFGSLPLEMQIYPWSVRNELEFHRKIILTPHFHFGGYIEKQICLFWGLENPKDLLFWKWDWIGCCEWIALSRVY